jgi:hypothetical protein
MISKNQTKCTLCNHIAFNYLIYDPNVQNVIFKKNRTNPFFKKTNGLINYWPFHENARDVIGTSHLTNGVNVSLTDDRNSVSLSAMSFNYGYMKAPTNYYFGDQNFTVMAWIKARSVSVWDKLIDFGTGSPNNNVICAISGLTVGVPRMVYLYNTGWKASADLKGMIEMNKWIHLSFVLAYPNGYIYFNGNQNSTTAIYNTYPRHVSRTSNFVGASNWPADGSINSDIDELKIFDRDLSKEEILNEMNNNYYF